jgi:hypothetical protein
MLDFDLTRRANALLLQLHILYNPCSLKQKGKTLIALRRASPNSSSSSTLNRCVYITNFKDNRELAYIADDLSAARWWYCSKFVGERKIFIWFGWVRGKAEQIRSSLFISRSTALLHGQQGGRLWWTNDVSFLGWQKRCEPPFSLLPVSRLPAPMTIKFHYSKSGWMSFEKEKRRSWASKLYITATNPNETTRSYCSFLSKTRPVFVCGG